MNPNETDEENQGLPSVNRPKPTNHLITALGFLFIVGAAGALILAANKDKSGKTKKEVPEKIANNLPPLMVVDAPVPPPPPPPITPVIEPSKPKPIDPPKTADGKPILHWTDRKMLGTLVIATDNQGENTAPQKVYQQPESDDTHSQEGKNNALAQQLEPTITIASTASFLPDRNYLITKGTSLDCALETAIDSTIPGLTTCRLTRDVYSDNGQVLLLDRGSQLVGEYVGGLKQGQVRLFVLWTRVKTPNGVIISLNSSGTDALGRAGLEGWVDNHFIERFSAAILISVLKDSIQIIANRSIPSNGSGTTNVIGNSATGGEKVAEKILDSTVNIPPTIIKNQGEHIQIMIARDLDFSDVYDLKQVKP